MLRIPVITNFEDVAARQLCSGCGGCAAAAPDRLEMVDTLEYGRRPRYRAGVQPGVEDSNLLSMCPGVSVASREPESDETVIESLRAGWGPIRAMFVGWATDDALRFRSSSGGAATVLAMAGLDHLEWSGVVHTKAREDQPLLNETVLSRTSEAIAEATGSRYSPASPGEGLRWLAEEDGRFGFIGKPCDVAAAKVLGGLRPEIGESIGGLISIFCAGTPTTRATLELCARLGVEDPADVVDLRYRGQGWPGPTTAVVRTSTGYETRTLDYETAWGEVLTNDKQWRCQVCADHTGEMADLSVGDAWHDRPDGDAGRSLILIRTARGQAIFDAAVECGLLHAERVEASALDQAQRNLLRGRGAVWGRLLTLKGLGLPVPRYRGMRMFPFWWRELSLREKVQSIAGTVRRAVRKRLHRRLNISAWTMTKRTGLTGAKASTDGRRDGDAHETSWQQSARRAA